MNWSKKPDKVSAGSSTRAIGGARNELVEEGAVAASPAAAAGSGRATNGPALAPAATAGSGSEVSGGKGGPPGAPSSPNNSSAFRRIASMRRDFSGDTAVSYLLRNVPKKSSLPTSLAAGGSALGNSGRSTVAPVNEDAGLAITEETAFGCARNVAEPVRKAGCCD